MSLTVDAPTAADARAARERFRAEFDAKYPKATAKLDQDGRPSPACAFADASAEIVCSSARLVLTVSVASCSAASSLTVASTDT